MKAIYREVKETKLDSPKMGRQARAEREFARWGVRDFAERMGISPSYLSELETGTRNWSEKLIEKFNKALK